MPVNLNGIIFDQVYGDNSGGAEFDTDGDGTATQEDEFVSFTNTTGAPVDVSGWQIWVDSAAGAGAPDSAQDGLYHTFPPGTVIAPGDTLYIVNEITGSPPSWAQEASEGGVESGAGGVSTNYLSEGNSSGADSLALVDPATGDYIVFNAGDVAENVSSESGFPGTTSLGEIDAYSVQADQNAGSSYQYNAGTDSYEYNTVFVPCFARGTMIETQDGPVAIEQIKNGDLVLTADHGAQPVLSRIVHRHQFMSREETKDRPILFRRGSLGPDTPRSDLVVSPQHRILISLHGAKPVLVPAKALLSFPGVRIKKGVRHVEYHHLVFANHEIIKAHGVWSESFLGGASARARMHPKMRIELDRVAPRATPTRAPEYAILGARQFERCRLGA